MIYNTHKYHFNWNLKNMIFAQGSDVVLPLVGSCFPAASLRVVKDKAVVPTAVSCRSEFFQYSTSGWRHFSCHFPAVLQCNSFFLSPPFLPRRLQYVADWIVCYYPAGDNIITTYLLSRVCKEWCCLGPQWSNNLTQGSRITHSWLGEVKHYQLERGVNKREVLSLSLSPSFFSRSLVKIEGDTPPLHQTEDAILSRLDRNISLFQVAKWYETVG